jgi:hypothetical protein
MKDSMRKLPGYRRRYDDIDSLHTGYSAISQYLKALAGHVILI